MIVVADTGPIVHLHWVGAAKWALPDEKVAVVDPVWDEVARLAPEALDDARISRVAQGDRDARVVSFQLDAAETAAISFALSQTAPVVLCDELRGRSACRTLGLRVAGSVGLIVQAVRARRVEPAVAIDALRELRVRGRLHVADEVIGEAVADVEAWAGRK